VLVCNATRIFLIYIRFVSPADIAKPVAQA
jgi:hypothetical protein